MMMMCAVLLSSVLLDTSALARMSHMLWRLGKVGCIYVGCVRRCTYLDRIMHFFKHHSLFSQSRKLNREVL